MLALAIFATFNVLWTPLAGELAGRPHQLSPSAIGLFGLVGIAGAITARHAGRLADRGHGRAASGSALDLMLAAWLPIALAGWSLPALVAGMLLVDVGVQTVHVISQSLVTAVDPDARSIGVHHEMGEVFNPHLGAQDPIFETLRAQIARQPPAVSAGAGG